MKEFNKSFGMSLIADDCCNRLDKGLRGRREIACGSNVLGGAWQRLPRAH